MIIPTLVLTPRRPALLRGFDNNLEVLVRLQAPDAPADNAPPRTALNLALVLDRSGSMSGQPLLEAKRCAAYVIDGLRTTDRAALVVYDNTIQVLVPSHQVTDKQRFYKALRQVNKGGMTNLHGGWLKGVEEVSAHLSDNAISRVILLSDGQANAGVRTPNTIFAQCAKLADADLTTSTYGLGRNFNEDLMLGMARAGRGNAYYARTADDLMDLFRQEFALLSALFAKQITLRFTVPSGVKAQVLNNYSTTSEGVYHLSDLAYSSEVWALLRLTIPKGFILNGLEENRIKVIEVAVSFKDLDGNVHTLPVAELTLPSLPPNAWDVIAEDELVVRRAAERDVAAALQEHAQRAAKRGDWSEVTRLLDEAKRNVKGNAWLQAVVNKLEALAARDKAMFIKESAYSAQRMRARLSE
jgi:Ca-activated chloride channel homolog